MAFDCKLDRLSFPFAAVGIAATLFAGCVSNPSSQTYLPPATQGYSSGQAGAKTAGSTSLDDLILVDCALPGQIRHLGNMIYQSPRRKVKLSRKECWVRGGEYVLFDRADYKSALSALLPKAQEGDPVAQTYVGEIYENGWGLAAPDYGRAAGWYRKAAENNHALAQIKLGSLYERGLGVPKDPAAALNWYRKSSGTGEDNLVYESALKAERNAFQQEIAARKQASAKLNQRLRNTEQALRDRQSEVKQAEKTVAATPGSVEAQHRLEALQTELNQLKRTAEEEKRVLTSELREEKNRANDLQKGIQGLDKLLDQANENLGQLRQSDARRAELEREVSQLQKIKASRKEQFDEILRLAQS